MKKLTDQELDSVFKNAAEGYEPVFDSGTWDAMNAKLDQPKTTLWRRWMPFALVGVIIFSAGVWVGTYLNEKMPMTQVQSESKDKSIQQAPMMAQNTPDQSKIQNQINSPQIGVGEGNKITKNQKIKGDTNPYHSNGTPNSEDHFESSIVIQRADNRNPIDETKFPSHDETNSIVEDASADRVNNLAQNQGEDVKDDVKKDTALADPTEGEKKEELTDSHSFYLRLLASPDFSSINYATATTAGSNYALLVDYQLTNRWSISTGGIWSMKKYSSDKETTYGKYTADRMVGDCRVLDIPVNVYYRFLPQSKISFYAGAGLSSYIMMEEDYTYTFDFPSGSRDFSYNIEKENNEWFKVLNVSLGAQYRIAQRFHLQVEPFLKAPLSGVGEWDVKLSSMGIFLGLKYKIN